MNQFHREFFLKFNNIYLQSTLLIFIVYLIIHQLFLYQNFFFHDASIRRVSFSLCKLCIVHSFQRGYFLSNKASNLASNNLADCYYWKTEMRYMLILDPYQMLCCGIWFWLIEFICYQSEYLVILDSSLLSLISLTRFFFLWIKFRTSCIS